MTLSRRSSNTLRSPNTPAWRSASASKNPAGTGLSYVFAEPEQGSPLAPVKFKLPLPQSNDPSESSFPEGPLPRLRQRLASMSSTKPVADINSQQSEGQSDGAGVPPPSSPASLEIPAANAHPVVVEEKASETHPAVDISSQKSPAMVPDAPLSSGSPPLPDSSARKSSWFGSISRAKAKTKKMEFGAAETQPFVESMNSAAPVSSSPVAESATPSAPSLHENSSSEQDSSKPQSNKGASIPALVVSTSSTTLSQTNFSKAQPAPKRSWFSSSVTPSAPASPSKPSDNASTPERTSIVEKPKSVMTSSVPPAPVAFPSSSSQEYPTSKRSISAEVSSIRPSDPRKDSDNSMPSSIDDEAPSVNSLTSPEAAVVSPALVANSSRGNDVQNGGQRLSSLNPSTSRFTLSIPLLGRSKVPLDQAVAVNPSSAIRVEPTTTEADQLEGSPSGTPPITSYSPPMVEPALEIADSSMPPDVHAHLQSASPSQQQIQQSSSWWSYVGWSSTPLPSTSAIADQGKTMPPATSSPTLDQVTNPTEPKITISATLNDSEPATSPASVLPDVIPMPQNDNTVTSTEIAIEDHDRAPPASIRSVASGSVWYSPWTWYSSPSTSALPESGSGDVINAENREEVDNMTQAEKVKEAALARLESVEGEVVHAEKEAEIGVSGVNPLEATISSNRSGWASFFSSRSLIVKAIKPADDVKVDENGMEVMDIEDDEADTKAQEPQRGRDARNSKDIGGDDTKPSKVGSKNQTPGSSSSSAPPSRSSSVKPDAQPKPLSSTGPKVSKATAPPLMISDSVKREMVKARPPHKREFKQSTTKKSSSPTPSSKGTPASKITVPNLILPTWADTFYTAPRSTVPPPLVSKLSKTVKFFSEVLFATETPKGQAKGKGREQDFLHFGKELPRAWEVMQGKPDPDVLKGCRRVVVIGIHGWFPGAVMRTVLGEPTGTSSKFVNMTMQALKEFQEEHNVKLEKITEIPLEGEGTIGGRVEKLYANLKAKQEWMDDLHDADAILVATHSQGSIVSTHLLDRLIEDRHIRTPRNVTTVSDATEGPPVFGLLSNVPFLKPQKVCCLALCGIHLGPLRYLNSSSLLQPYFQYFESAAARELFEFQSTESQVSKNYVKALRNVLDHGTKMLYVASLNDQVVPIYSGLFTAASHPMILRALYIDGDAYHSSDFLSNLFVLLLRILNSGISDSGLTVHLSEATAGSLNGIGHSTVYEELATYSLAVKYLFLTNNGSEDRRNELNLEPFNAATEQNDYEIPWSLRDVIADERVAHFFRKEITDLRDAFRDWHPKTTILRDLKRKLQPIQRLPTSLPSPSKL